MWVLIHENCEMTSVWEAALAEVAKLPAAEQSALASLMLVNAGTPKESMP